MFYFYSGLMRPMVWYASNRALVSAFPDTRGPSWPTCLLDGRSDDVGVLLDLTGNAHVDVLVTDRHNHASNQRRINLGGKLNGLVRFQECLESIFQLFALSIIQWFRCLDLAHHLTALGGHDQAERINDTVQAAQASILSQHGEQVTSGRVELYLGSNILQGGSLHVALGRGITQQIAHLRVRAHLVLEPFQVLLHSIQRLRLGGGRVEGAGIPTLQTEHLYRWLNQLSGGRAGAQLTSEYGQFPGCSHLSRTKILLAKCFSRIAK
uniref:Putative secreted protein n=1 Tax=Anopheles aquasalis TaxID=42839 RepID=T1E7J5_ANOAQ